MDRHGNCAGVVAAAQLEAGNMAGVMSPDLNGPFVLLLGGEEPFGANRKGDGTL